MQVACKAVRVAAHLPRPPARRRHRHPVVAAAAPSGGPQPQAATPTIVTDAAVPEGHQGLHGFLYGEGGAEAHDAGSSYTFREARLPVAGRAPLRRMSALNRRGAALHAQCACCTN